MRAVREGRNRSRFPLLVTLACVATGLTLFFTTTMPALRERATLTSVAAEQARLRAQLDELRTRTLRTREALRHDPQTILLEIDRLGMIPDELLPPASEGR